MEPQGYSSTFHSIDLGKYFYRKQFVSSEGTNSILQVYHHMLWKHNVAKECRLSHPSHSVSVQGLNYAVRFLKTRYMHMLREYLVSVA